MDMHQVFNIIDQRTQCPYCHSNISKESWHSHFHSSQMYKAFHCKCGKFLNVPVSFLGSGHDNWDQKNSWADDPNIEQTIKPHKVKTLESRIKIIKNYKMHP